MKGIKESVQAEETEVGRSALPAGGRGELARAPTSPLGVRSGFSEMENCQQAGFKQGTGQVKVVERYSECRLKNANCVWRVLGPGTECPALCSCPVASDLGIFSLQTPYSVNVTVPESQLPTGPACHTPALPSASVFGPCPYAHRQQPPWKLKAVSRSSPSKQPSFRLSAAEPCDIGLCVWSTGRGHKQSQG